MTTARILIACASLFVLSGCGGGGGSDGPTVADADGDGVADSLDAFPNDPTESADSDSDSIGDNADVDDDGDGLIEISSLQQLDWMRNDLLGSSLTDHNGSANAVGCPVDSCDGYELVTNLNFDTNGDGLMDTNDTYFDYDGDGTNAGWLPIGSDSEPFRANFDGNGFVIQNLYIDRWDPVNGSIETAYVGLFGWADGSEDGLGFSSPPGITLRNLRFEGELTDIEGRNAGMLAGQLIGVAVENVQAAGIVSANLAGGLVSQFLNSTIADSETHGSVVAQGTGGGLIATMIGSVSGSHVKNCTSSADVFPPGPSQGLGNALSMGGLIGEMLAETSITNSSASGDVWGDNFSAFLTANTGVGGLVGNVDGNDKVYNVSVDQVNEALIANSHASGYVRGDFNVGGLVGYAENAVEITESYSTGTIAGFFFPPDDSPTSGALVAPVKGYVGGLIGLAYPDGNRDGTIVLVKNSFSTSHIEHSSDFAAGGLIGRAENTHVRASFTSGRVDGLGPVRGGFIGQTGTGTQIYGNLSMSTLLIEDINDISYPNVERDLLSYDGAGLFIGQSDDTFVADNHQVDHEYSSVIDATGRGSTTPVADNVGIEPLINLQCPIAASDATCTGEALYLNWDVYLNETEELVWDFGDATQAPGLSFGGAVYRDGDGDGVLD